MPRSIAVILWPGGWLGGWLGGHSDNKANPRGLELELGLGFAIIK